VYQSRLKVVLLQCICTLAESDLNGSAPLLFSVANLDDMQWILSVPFGDALGYPKNVTRRYSKKKVKQKY
jgi:hypothetical protein